MGAEMMGAEMMGAEIIVFGELGSEEFGPSATVWRTSLVERVL